MFKRIAIFSQNSDERTLASLKELAELLYSKGVEFFLFEKSSGVPLCHSGNMKRFGDIGALSPPPDLVLSVGGDGTFLETMLRVREYGIPVAGINTGRLGFLANIPGEDVAMAIDMLFGGRYRIVKRALLKSEEPAALFGDKSAYALNEITVQKSDLNMITIRVYIDGVHLNTYWADGLIISTATGSTAYNLSVGGPILSPEDTSIIIAPISPHNLTIRPIVVAGSSTVNMVVEGRGREYLVTCDFRWTKLPFSNGITIRQPSEKLATIVPEGSDFFSTLRTKLMWGADKRN